MAIIYSPLSKSNQYFIGFVFGFLFSIHGYSQLDFRHPIFPDSTTTPASMELGDFDGDQLVDIAFTTVTNSKVFIIYSEANNEYSAIHSFQAGLVVQSNGYSTKITVGDFNNDGKDDLIAFNSYDNSIQKIFVLLSNGRTFQTPKVIETIASLQGLGIDCGDVNNDGFLDFVVGFQDLHSEFHVYLGNGTGDFTLNKVVNLQSVDKLILTDINSDNKLDIISGNRSALSRLQVFLGDGFGNFTFKTTLQNSQTPLDFTVADFSEDNIPDIISNPINSPFLDFFIGDGTGNFIKNSIPISDNIIPYFGIDALDYNADGRPDFVMSGFKNGELTVFFTNNGNNQFNQQNYSNNAVSFTYSIRSADINKDGKFEIISNNDKRISIRSQDNSNQFTQISSIHYGTHPLIGAASDLNQDGLYDVICANTWNNSISIHYSEGDGDFSEPVFYSTDSPPKDLEVHDINFDGYMDIIYSTSQGAQNEIGLILSDHSGKLEERKSINTSTNAFEVSDFNNDGKLDIFSNYAMYSGNGDGTFSYNFISMQAYPLAMKSGDFDNDGNMDVFTTTVSDQATFYYGNGLGSFTAVPFQFQDKGIYPQSYDLNTDGLLDLVVASPNTNSISILKNLGNRLWEESKLNLNQFNNPSDVAISDFNKDGLQDLAISNSYASNVIVLLAKSYFEFDFYATLPVHGTSGYLISQDFNLDSKPDLFSFNYNGFPMTLLLNDLVQEPTAAPMNMGITNRTDSSVSYSFSPGNGNGRLVVLTENSQPNLAPSDGQFYSANNQYGLGFALGNSFVVKRGLVTNGEVLNLKPNTEYFISVYEYQSNQKNTIINFFNLTPLSGTFKTKSNQTIDFTSILDRIESDPDFTLTALSTSNLPVTFTKLSGNIDLVGNIVKILGPNPAIIQASQSGNDDYMSALNVEQSFCIDPIVPVITITSLGLGQYTLSSSSDINNFWQLNGNPITDATNKTFDPISDGVYSVRVDYSGCYNVSLPTSNLITGLVEFETQIYLYPNPAKDRIFIQNQDLAIKKLVIHDLLGRKQFVPVIIDDNYIILEIYELNSGIYGIVIELKDRIFVTRFIKDKN